MTQKNFLIELGTEELPPTALRTLAEAFAANFEAELKAADLPHDGIKWYAAPRRLALKVTGLAENQPDKVVEKRGPAVSAAFDAEGNPTKAAQGWARGNGITVDQAERMVTDKGEWLLFKQEVKGQPAQTLLPELAAAALAKLPIPRPMRWGDKETQFIRPVKTLTMLECKPVTGEITYGIERLAMYIQNVDSVYDLVWTDGPLGKVTYGDIFHQNEVEQSTYNFEHADVDFLFTFFDQCEKESIKLLELEQPLPLPAYERILKAAHAFNLLDARKAISVTERQRYILRIRNVTKQVAEAYYASREALGFPMCKKDK